MHKHFTKFQAPSLQEEINVANDINKSFCIKMNIANKNDKIKELRNLSDKMIRNIIYA